MIFPFNSDAGHLRWHLHFAGANVRLADSFSAPNSAPSKPSVLTVAVRKYQYDARMSGFSKSPDLPAWQLLNVDANLWHACPCFSSSRLLSV